MLAFGSKDWRPIAEPRRASSPLAFRHRARRIKRLCRQGGCIDQARDLIISYGSILAGIALRIILYPRQSGRYLDSSHSSREIPACLKIFMSRSTLMSSPRCELGMTTESSPLAITSCFDPGNGPSNANFLNLRISSLLETGVSLFDNAYRLRRNYN